jgi:hypothetical protein
LIVINKHVINLIASVVDEQSDIEINASNRSHSDFRDECFKCLAKVPINPDLAQVYLTQHKYYAQAHKLVYFVDSRIKEPYFIPPFIINISDLTPELKAEFKWFVNGSTDRQITLFLKEIAIPFFGNIDFDFCHLSVLKHLQVEYEP